MRGIDKFKERFAGHDGEEPRVLIGGGAMRPAVRRSWSGLQVLGLIDGLVLLQ